MQKTCRTERLVRKGDVKKEMIILYFTSRHKTCLYEDALCSSATWYTTHSYSIYGSWVVAAIISSFSSCIVRSRAHPHTYDKNLAMNSRHAMNFLESVSGIISRHWEDKMLPYGHEKEVLSVFSNFGKVWLRKRQMANSFFLSCFQTVVAGSFLGKIFLWTTSYFRFWTRIIFVTS